MTKNVTMHQPPMGLKEIAGLQRPMELDLEAAFKIIESDAIQELAKAIDEGMSPMQAVDMVLVLISDKGHEEARDASGKTG